jgi:hypothetical protein
MILGAVRSNDRQTRGGWDVTCALSYLIHLVKHMPCNNNNNYF